MTRVYLTTTVPPGPGALYDDVRFMEALAGAALSSAATAVDQPGNADLVCFVSAQRDDLRDILRSPLYGKHRSRVVTIQTRDTVYPRIPGLYASASAEECSRIGIRSCCYPRVSATFDAAVDTEENKYLYSFVGSCRTARVRRRLMGLHDDRALIIDTDAYAAGPWASRYSERDREFFARTMCQSKFIICPRGRGLSSMRLFEALAAGRVPVILGDGFALPPGPDWASFSITVREKDFGTLPQLLRTHESQFGNMATKARACWETWYSQERAFGTLVKHCEEALKAWQPFPAQMRRVRQCFSRHYVTYILLPEILRTAVAVKHRLGIRVSLTRPFRETHPKA